MPGYGRGSMCYIRMKYETICCSEYLAAKALVEASKTSLLEDRERSFRNARVNSSL